LAATLLDRHEKKAETHATPTDASIIKGITLDETPDTTILFSSERLAKSGHFGAIDIMNTPPLRRHRTTVQKAGINSRDSRNSSEGSGHADDPLLREAESQ